MKGFALCRAGRAHWAESNTGRSPTLVPGTRWGRRRSPGWEVVQTDGGSGSGRGQMADSLSKPWLTAASPAPPADSATRRPPWTERWLIDASGTPGGCFGSGGRRWRGPMFWPLGVDSGANTSGGVCDGISFVWLVSAGLINWWLDLHNSVRVTQFFWSGTDPICCSSTSAEASGLSETRGWRCAVLVRNRWNFNYFTCSSKKTSFISPPNNHWTRDWKLEFAPICANCCCRPSCPTLWKLFFGNGYRFLFFIF